MAKTYDLDTNKETSSIPERQKLKKLALNDGPVTPVKVYEDVDGYGKAYKRVLPDHGVGRIGKVKYKKGKV
jgi:hypothetical protein